MIVEMGKKYKTRDGREVRIYATDGYGVHPIHGSIRARSGDGWIACMWSLSGAWCLNSEEHDNDLIEVKPRIQREVWLNVYPSGIQHCTHDTKELADKNCCSDRIACVKITIDCEEGEGL